jgi:hypothetical protein
MRRVGRTLSNIKKKVEEYMHFNNGQIRNLGIVLSYLQIPIVHLAKGFFLY